MGVYIWLLLRDLVYFCAGGSGCVPSTNTHLDYLIAIGAVELLGEIAGVLRVYIKKNGNGK